MNSPSSQEFRFGPFRLLPERALLLRDGAPVRLGSRATEILVHLVRRAGQLVSKQAIMEAVWPDTTVVEANLSVHMSALRRALGDDEAVSPLIVTVSGRGYRFVATVEAVVDPGAVTGAEAPRSNLPVLLTRLIGRDQMLARLAAELADHPLLTVVGTGGVGKTSLALHAAERQIAGRRDGVWIADFGALDDPDLAAPSLAAVLGIELRSDNPVPALIRALADKDMLLLLDNCEHLLEATAQLANAIVQAAPGVAIIATSREPLAIPGERVLRLEPLDTPPEGELVGADRALSYASVQLLADRVRANDAAFELTDRDALAACLICRKLGGLPLAIEFASALIPIFGVAGLSSRLDDRLRLLSGGRHSILPRHRTLDAALDWSFQLLEPHEQSVLLELAIFSGGFSIEAAQAVIGRESESAEIGDILAQLVRKSLVSPDIRGTILRFRLLEPTRAFLLGRLERHSGRQRLQRQHAGYFADALHGRRHMAAAREDPGAFVPDIDNIRAALTWALSDTGDRALAIALCAGAVPIWFGLSLLSECSRRAHTLIAMMTEEERLSPNGSAIDLAIASTQIFLHGAAAENYADWTMRERAAADEGHYIERIRLLLGRWTYNIRHPDYAAAESLIEDMARINDRRPSPSPDASALSPLVEPAHLRATELWMRGTTRNHRGYFDQARACFERFLDAETDAMRTFWMAITGFDRRSDALGLLGMTKCLVGDVEAGLADVDAGIAAARTTGKALPICEALQWAGFSKLIMGEPLTVTKPLVAELLRTSKDHSLFSHFGVALCLKGSEALRSGHAQLAIELLTQGLIQLRDANYGPFDPYFEGVLAQAHVATGQARLARSRIEGFMQSRAALDCFCSAELLRQHAKLVVLTGEADKAEALLRAANDLAERQDAVPWKIRVVADLCALLRARERVDEADRLADHAAETIDDALRRRILLPVDGSRSL